MNWQEREMGTGDGEDRDNSYPATLTGTALCHQPSPQGQRFREMPLWGRKTRLPPARSPCPRQPHWLLSSVGSGCGHWHPSAQGLTVCQALGAPPTRSAGLCPRSQCQDTRDKAHAAPGRAPGHTHTALPWGLGGQKARTRTSGPLVCCFTSPVSVSARGPVRSPIPDASTL